jgi:hypothetical protein
VQRRRPAAAVPTDTKAQAARETEAMKINALKPAEHLINGDVLIPAETFAFIEVCIAQGIHQLAIHSKAEGKTALMNQAADLLGVRQKGIVRSSPPRRGKLGFNWH